MIDDRSSYNPYMKSSAGRNYNKDRDSIPSRVSNPNFSGKNSVFHKINNQENQNSSNRRKRPMSAKNPLLLNQLHRNEQSTPHLIGEDIINIQNQVINEEDDYTMVPTIEYDLLNV